MLIWQTGRGRRAQRRMIAWTRYQARYDKLTAGQRCCGAGVPGAAVRTTPGYFRAEGWNPLPYDLRHGA
jgi:hypothetical protein